MTVAISQYISEHSSLHPFSVYICDNVERITTDVIQARAQEVFCTFILPLNLAANLAHVRIKP